MEKSLSVSDKPNIERIFIVISRLLGLWFAACFIWALYVFSNDYFISMNLDANTFKESCIEREGKVRHDQWMINVDLYCMEFNGNESVFVFNGIESRFSEVFFNKLFLGSIDFTATN